MAGSYKKRGSKSEAVKAGQSKRNDLAKRRSLMYHRDNFFLYFERLIYGKL